MVFRVPKIFQIRVFEGNLRFGERGKGKIAEREGWEEGTRIKKERKKGGVFVVVILVAPW